MIKKGSFLIYSTGLVQGLTLVAFPAASRIFTSPENFDLSSTSYGALFIPQALLSITAAWISSKLSGKARLSSLFSIGLMANLFSMLLFTASFFAMGHREVAYVILLVATACLGLGFGLTVPALNTYVALLFPKKVDQAVLLLNALLGIGTACAPLFIALFIGLGMWWGLPLFLTLLLLGLVLSTLISSTLPAEKHIEKISVEHQTSLPWPFWLFALFALFYGIIETINGNWSTVYMTTQMGANASMTSFALTIFWAMTTLGRIMFAMLARIIPEKVIYRILPLIVGCAFILLACLEPGSGAMALLAFGLAGLGCSALLPLTLSFCSKAMVRRKGAATAGLIAFYLVGYGIAAFGAGPLQDIGGITLRKIFGSSTIIALLLAALAMVIMKKKEIKT